MIFPNFTTLKKVITILFFALGFSTALIAQNRTAYPSEQGSKIVRSYPNPATVAINFEFLQDFDKSYTIQLYNFMGKKVYEFTPNSERMNISLNGFFRGVYIYQLRDKFGKILDSGKFQVVR